MVTFVEKKNTATKLGMVMHTYIPGLGRLTQEDCYEFKAILDHIVCSRPAWTIERPCLEKQKYVYL